MVSASVNRCCPICTAAGLTLAQSLAFHAKEEDRTEKAFVWLFAAGLGVLYLAGIVMVGFLIGRWWS